VLAEFESVVSLGGLMKKLVAVIFFAMLTGNAMAQAGGASPGASGATTAGAAGSTATTVGVVATIVVMVGGVFASVGNTAPVAQPATHH
jgi:hypothetical protein